MSIENFFQELLKKTPAEHPDYEPVKAALDLMKTVCSNVNETKRQLEQLEKLDDLQASIANWEVNFVSALLALDLLVDFAIFFLTKCNKICRICFHNG